MKQSIFRCAIVVLALGAVLLSSCSKRAGHSKLQSSDGLTGAQVESNSESALESVSESQFSLEAEEFKLPGVSKKQCRELPANEQDFLVQELERINHDYPEAMSSAAFDPLSASDLSRALELRRRELDNQAKRFEALTLLRVRAGSLSQDAADAQIAEASQQFADELKAFEDQMTALLEHARTSARLKAGAAVSAQRSRKTASCPSTPRLTYKLEGKVCLVARNDLTVSVLSCDGKMLIMGMIIENTWASASGPKGKWKMKKKDQVKIYRYDFEDFCSACDSGRQVAGLPDHVLNNTNNLATSSSTSSSVVQTSSSTSTSASTSSPSSASTAAFTSSMTSSAAAAAAAAMTSTSSSVSTSSPGMSSSSMMTSPGSSASSSLHSP